MHPSAQKWGRSMALRAMPSVIASACTILPCAWCARMLTSCRMLATTRWDHQLLFVHECGSAIVTWSYQHLCEGFIYIDVWILFIRVGCNFSWSEVYVLYFINPERCLSALWGPPRSSATRPMEMLWRRKLSNSRKRSTMQSWRLWRSNRMANLIHLKIRSGLVTPIQILLLDKPQYPLLRMYDL